MSGGHFDYYQFTMDDTIDDLKELLTEEYNFSSDTIVRIRECIHHLEMGQLLLHRIDWMVCGDDSEETFHKRINEDLIELYKEN